MPLMVLQAFHLVGLLAFVLERLVSPLQMGEWGHIRLIGVTTAYYLENQSVENADAIGYALGMIIWATHHLFNTFRINFTYLNAKKIRFQRKMSKLNLKIKYHPKKLKN